MSAHPVTPQQYTIPLLQRPSSVTPQQQVISTANTVLHPVTPQQYTIPLLQTPSSVTPHHQVISTANRVLHPATPQQLPIFTTVHPVTPQPLIIPTVHVTSDISEPAVSMDPATGAQNVNQITSSSSNSELQLSSQELSGVPATLQLIFDLKKQTAARLAETTSERLRRFVEDLLQQPVTGATGSIEATIQQAVGLACRVCDQQLFLLVDWARQAHFFCHLMVNPAYLRTFQL